MDANVIMKFGIENQEELCNRVKDYWRRLKESDGFDIEGIRAPPGAIPLIPYNCQLSDSTHPDPVLVKLYARAGLHHYNMFQGTHFELVAVMKFNKLLMFLSPFYITLLAQDSVSGFPQTAFQVRVDEHRICSLDLTVLIARPKGIPVSTNEPVLALQSLSVDKLPEWPSDFSDGKRFYVVKQSELQDYDWIYLYLELLLASFGRGRISDNDLSQLKIEQAVIETTEDMLLPNERFYAKTAVVYISFNGLTRKRILGGGVFVDRKAIIRRDFDEHTGYLSLRGEFFGEKEEISDPASFFNSPAYLNDLRNQELPVFMR